MTRRDDDPRLRIGLTGGIASGKSLAAASFRRRGAAVLDADQGARAVTAPGMPGLNALVVDHAATLLPDGHLDRRTLRERMFGDAALRAAIEAELHPRILDWLDAAARDTPGPYVVHVVPLLVERNLGDRFDRVAVVDCPEPLQLERLLARDGVTDASAQAILAAQASRRERRALADDLIDNSGSREALDAAIGQLHESYLALSAAPPFPHAGRGGQNSGP